MASRKLGEVVQQLREARGMTQAQLAERAQLSVSFVSILEGGQSSNDPSRLSWAAWRGPSALA